MNIAGTGVRLTLYWYGGQDGDDVITHEVNDTSTEIVVIHGLKRTFERLRLQ